MRMRFGRAEGPRSQGAVTATERGRLKQGEVVSLVVLGMFALAIVGVLFVVPGMRQAAQATAQEEGAGSAEAGVVASPGLSDGAATGAGPATGEGVGTAEGAAGGSGATGSAAGSSEGDTGPTVWDEEAGAARPMTVEEKSANDAANERERTQLAEYEEQLAPYKKTVPLGETFSLANIDDGTVAITNPYTGERVETGVSRFVMWTGTLDVTVLDATVYDALPAAQAELELGEVLSAEPPANLNDPRLLVMHVQVTNVDATPGLDGIWYDAFPAEAFAPNYVADGSSTVLAPSLATFDGAQKGLDAHDMERNDFVLAQGETRTLTLGFWVEGSSLDELVVRPSLSASNPGPIAFDLGLGAED